MSVVGGINRPDENASSVITFMEVFIMSIEITEISRNYARWIYDGPHGMEGEFLDAIKEYATHAEAIKVQVGYASDYVGFSEAMVMLKTDIDDIDERAEIFVSLQPKYPNVSSVEGYKRLYRSIKEQLAKLDDMYTFDDPAYSEAEECEQKYLDDSLEDLYIWISDEIRDAVVESVCQTIDYYRTTDLDNVAISFVLENLYAISLMDNELLDMVCIGIAEQCVDRYHKPYMDISRSSLLENTTDDVGEFANTLLEDIYFSDLDTVKESGLEYLALDDN